MELKQIAHKIKSYYDYRERPFVARPYNRYKAADTVWWIIPSNEWPAHKLAKFIILEGDQKIFFGFNVEKGYGENLGIGLAQKHILSPDWSWHSFNEDLKSGKIDEVIKEINQKFNKSVKISIAVGVFNPGIDNSEEKYSNKISFEIENGEVFNFNNDLQSGYGTNLQNLNSVNSMADLYNKIFEQSVDFYWLDFILSVGYEKDEIKDDNKFFDQIHRMLSKFDYLL